MTLLITNDDGIDAPGLGALAERRACLRHGVVVAPAGPQSGVSHAVTTGPGRAVRGTRRRSLRRGRHAGRLRPRRPAPSGARTRPGCCPASTTAATSGPTCTTPAPWPPSARRSCTAGRASPSRTTAPRTATSTGRGPSAGSRRCCASLLTRTPEPGLFWNVNLPHTRPDQPDPEVVECGLDPRPLPLDYIHHGENMTYSGGLPPAAARGRAGRGRVLLRADRRHGDPAVLTPRGPLRRVRRPSVRPSLFPRQG